MANVDIPFSFSLFYYYAQWATLTQRRFYCGCVNVEAGRNGAHRFWRSIISKFKRGKRYSGVRSEHENAPDLWAPRSDPAIVSLTSGGVVELNFSSGNKTFPPSTFSANLLSWLCFYLKLKRYSLCSSFCYQAELQFCRGRNNWQLTNHSIEVSLRLGSVGN